MAKKDGITIATANARLKALEKTFGFDSEVYQMASDYIKEKIDDEYIVKNDAGDIIRIKAHQGVEVEKEKSWINKNGKEVTQKYKVIEGGVDLENAFGRAELFDEQLPTVTSIIKRTMAAEGIEGTIKDNKLVVAPLANAYAHVIRNFDDKVHEVYGVRDDEGSLGYYDRPLADSYHDKAVDLLAERKKAIEWIARANNLINEYWAAVEDKKRQKE